MNRLVADAETDGALAVVRRRLAEGTGLPGFGHSLYAGIDPRAAALLESVDLSSPLARLRDAVCKEAGIAPNIDFALLALTQSHRLPHDAPRVFFAAGRTAGWLAHAVEQVTTGSLIRPRAHYVGPELEP